MIVRVPDPFTAGVPVGAATALDGVPPLLVGKFVDVEIQGLAPANATSGCAAPRIAARR